MTGTVEVSVHVAAAPETVFPYFTDPARYVQWMGSEAALDPRPGGVYQVSMSDGFRAAGTFGAVDPPRQVVFTWGFADHEAASHTLHQRGEATSGSAMPAGSTRVTVTLQPEDGGTLSAILVNSPGGHRNLRQRRLGGQCPQGTVQRAAGDGAGRPSRDVRIAGDLWRKPGGFMPVSSLLCEGFAPYVSGVSRNVRRFPAGGRPPAAIGAVDSPRGRTLHMPGTGSQRYSSSARPSRRGRRCVRQCQSSCQSSWLFHSMPMPLTLDGERGVRRVRSG
jgi:uncharacterized protein YndB with AHSA1/START domain